MAGGIVTMQRDGSSRPGRPSLEDLASGVLQNPGWITTALGTAVVLAGLGSRRKGTVTLALVALASAAAVGTMRSKQLDRGNADSKGPGGTSVGKPEVERSITVSKTPDELYQRLVDPKTLPQIMAGFATVRASNGGRMHWKVESPYGRTYEWESEAVDNQPGQGIGWRSLPGAAISNDGSVRFRPAPAGRGTVATLHLRFGRPGGALGNAAVTLLGTMPLDLAVDGVLRRFKSLAETREIPTTARQPAARADTR